MLGLNLKNKILSIVSVLKFLPRSTVDTVRHETCLRYKRLTLHLNVMYSNLFEEGIKRIDISLFDRWYDK